MTLSQQTASGPSQLQLSHLLPPSLHDHLLPLTLVVGVVEGGEQGQDGRSLLHPQKAPMAHWRKQFWAWHCCCCSAASTAPDSGKAASEQLRDRAADNWRAAHKVEQGVTWKPKVTWMTLGCQGNISIKGKQQQGNGNWAITSLALMGGFLN